MAIGREIICHIFFHRVRWRILRGVNENVSGIRDMHISRTGLVGRDLCRIFSGVKVMISAYGGKGRWLKW